jgi:hypothetical protein
MRPLVVDTKFIRTAKNLTVEKEVGDWTVQWTLAAGPAGDIMQTLLASGLVMPIGICQSRGTFSGQPLRIFNALAL